MQTDASDDFWSAVLLELVDIGQEELCGYASGEFNSHQKNYFTAEKETLAIFNGIQRFELYLAPRRFLIRTDSKNFQYFLKAKLNRQMARGRLLSWQVWFSQYDFNVEWIPGSTNHLADALTREMAKAYRVVKIKLLDPDFRIFQSTEEPDTMETLAERIRILEDYMPMTVAEIRKIVGMRLRRNEIISSYQAWRSRNIGPQLGFPEDLLKVYPLPNRKVKLYFVSLSDLWMI